MTISNTVVEKFKNHLSETDSTLSIDLNVRVLTTGTNNMILFTNSDCGGRVGQSLSQTDRSH